MKEIIIIKDDKFVRQMRNSILIGYPLDFEQVPETFEELKELCKQTGHYAIDINNGSGLFYKDSIYVFNLTFKDNGEIDDNENNTVAENLTPAQMWTIIKNLIGE